MAKYRSGLTAYADGQVDPEQVLNPAIDRAWDAGPGGKLLTKTLAGDIDLTRDEVQANGVLLFDGSPGATVTVDFPPTDAANGWHGERLVYVVNATADGSDVTFRFDADANDVADGATVTIASGLGAWLRVKEPDVTRDAFTDFLTLSDTPASFGGQGRKSVRVNAGETALEFIDTAYDIGHYFPGQPGDGALMAQLIVNRAFTIPSGAPSSQGYAGTAPSGGVSFDLRKNNGSFGTCDFAASAQTATFTVASDTAFAAGDRLQILAPSPQDANLADVSITLFGRR